MAYSDGPAAPQSPTLNPQAAAKVAQSCPSKAFSEGEEQPASTVQSSPYFREEETTFARPKKRWLASKQVELWKPESCKKPKKDTENRVTQLTERSLNATVTARSKKVRKKRRKKVSKKKWTPDLDDRLKEGVRKHGEGNWKLMLQDQDFRGRTGTMLKDRWRILKRNMTS